ncbi:MAG: glycosyltransferase family protein [Planctomycetota bacterium]|jgi:glycosyltransferase involved in cell wall biosynthesis
MMPTLPVQDRPRPAPVPAAEVRRQLLDHRQAGRREAFIDLAYRYLEAVPRDPPIALELLRALVELGLGEPARELLATRPDLTEAGDTASLRQALDGLPAAAVPWARLRPRFLANLDACLASRPYLHALRADLEAAVEGLELFEGNDSGLHLGRLGPDGQRQWQPGFGLGGADTVALPLGAAGPAAAVIGTGLSPLAQRAYLATRPDGQSPAAPLFVLDDDLARAAAWLHALDLADLLADDRVGVFLGPDALPDYERFLREHEDLVIPEVWLVPAWAEAAGREAQAAARRVAEQRGRGITEIAARLDQRAGQRSVADWAARLEPGSTVLGFTSRATTMLQYSMRDIGHAFEALGYRFRLVIERGDHCRHTPLTIARAVWETDPALVVLINHFRHEQPQALGGGPLLSWIQDPTDVVLSRRTGSGIGPLDFVCGYYRRRCTEELGYPAQRFFQAPLAVSTRVFHDAPVDAADAKRYACDLMYVGHLHDTVEEHLARWRSTVPSGLHRLLERLRHEVTGRCELGEHLAHPNEARAFTRAAADELGVQVEDEAMEQLAHYFVYRLNDIIFRRETLTWAAHWAERTGRVLRIYGKGWQRDPELGTYAAGPIEHGEPLRRAYRSSKLALQTLPSGFKHQRAFEAIASGCLVLGRAVAADFDGGAERFFPELDHVVFRNADELASVASGLLDDAPRRRELHADFRAAVQQSFTYEAVLRDVLDRITTALAGNAASR